MRSSFAKSIYVGAAVLGLAGLSAVTTTTASAKSHVTVGAYTALTKGQNVTVTGTNAIYSKPGTVKGAKVVASKKTVAKLAASKKSSDTFYAYGTKTTNRGSVYYKIVTMDKKYRGYIYGGKTAGTFAGGIKTTDTMTKAAVPSQTTVYFANPGTTNVTWTAPKNTDINAKKNVVNTTPFAGDKLTITDAATKTKEGSLYYYVKDATHPSVSGWIYSGAVTSDAKVAFNQATDVKVNLVNDGKTVVSGVLQNLLADSTKEAANAVGTAVGTDATAKAVGGATPWVDTQLAGTGYTYDKASNANAAALLAAKTGDTITLNVTKGTSVTSTINAYETKVDKDGITVTNTKLNNVNAKAYTDAVTAAGKDNSAISYQAFGKDTVVFPTLTAGFTGVSGANYTSADLTKFANDNKLGTLYSPTFYVKASGDTTAADSKTAGVPAYVKYTLTSANKGTYGKNAQVFYTSEIVYNQESPAKVSANSGNAIFS